MAKEEEYYDVQQYSQELNIKIRDLEEKQRVLKDRILLIGQNLIEARERTEEKILEIKKDIEELKSETQKIKSFLQSISEEIGKFARKEDLEILIKQAKMFQPLNQ